MRHGALFNGIGGFQLAAHWMGWENVFHCEIDPFCNRVVKKHFPASISYEDIKQTDFREWRGAIDIISGGFPCQPYSTAGKRLGKNDARHLWPEMLRAIREVQPRWVVGENVRGLTNWNGGMVFDEVQADLETEGYEVLPFLLPAAGVNAPHERYRIWFIAYTSGERCETRKDFIGPEEWGRQDSGERITTDAVQFDGSEIQIKEGGEPIIRSESIGIRKTWRNMGWDGWPSEHPISSRDDGISAQLAGLSVSGYRRASISALGNAVIPGLVLQIFKAIEQYEKLLNPYSNTSF